MPAADASRTLRWPWSSLWGDLLRGGGGALIAVLAALMNTPASLWQLCLLGLAAILGTLAVLALRKRMTRVALTEQGLNVRTPFARPKTIQWSALTMLELRYYGARVRTVRPSGGFMELTLQAGQSRLILDDGIEGFDDVLQAALGAARTKELGLSAVTETNLAHLLKTK